MSTPIISQPTEQQALFIDMLLYRVGVTLSDVDLTPPNLKKLLHAAAIARRCAVSCSDLSAIGALSQSQRTGIVEDISLKLPDSWSRLMVTEFFDVFFSHVSVSSLFIQDQAGGAK